VLDNVLRTHH